RPHPLAQAVGRCARLSKANCRDVWTLPVARQHGVFSALAAMGASARRKRSPPPLQATSHRRPAPPRHWLHDRESSWCYYPCLRHANQVAVPWAEPIEAIGKQIERFDANDVVIV